ncbi:hypothetical protein Adt_30779 [Abeliophyllum distichum]|uniref:Uncharacterized protein n=1 Tax=Abeliophyllum distichum TaxID=126358 RepID=A0ABD1RC65_9LAMI
MSPPVVRRLTSVLLRGRFSKNDKDTSVGLEGFRRAHLFPWIQPLHRTLHEEHPTSFVKMLGLMTLGLQCMKPSSAEWRGKLHVLQQIWRRDYQGLCQTMLRRLPRTRTTVGV